MPSTAVPTGVATHPSLHIRDARDAHVLLEAVRLNTLPLIRHRLTANEREQLVSGNIFVWEEAENDGGLLRWTDGRRWSQSRMRGDYLFYEEKMETTQEEKDAKAALRARRATDPLAIAPSTNRRKDRPNRPNGLTKQTYSALAYLPGLSHPRKWHVVAYFAGDDYLRLPVIESYEYLRNVRAPEGIFVSTKGNGVRNERSSMPDSKDTHTAPHFPAQLDLAFSPEHPMSHDVTSEPMSPISPSMSSPLSPPHQHPSPPLSQSVTSSHHPQESPPSMASVFLTNPNPHHQLIPPSQSPSHPVHLSHPSPTNYRPLSAEDRRVLSSFRVVL